MKKNSIFCLVIFLALFVRLYNINWDNGYHLHPDERFITMVGITEKLPANLIQYFNPATSPLNPHTLGFSFFVYGTFPLTLNFLISLVFHSQTYQNFTLQGRILSALFDVGTCFFVYLIAQLLKQKYHLSYLFPISSFFIYALAVLPIQLSHFYTVDMFANFFLTSSLYFSLHFFFSEKTRYLVISAILFGIGLASKISVLIIFPLLLILIFLPHTKKTEGQFSLTLTSLFIFVIKFSLFLFVTYFAGRIADPYLFQTSNLFIPSPNSLFLQNLKILQFEYSPSTIFPPAFQWLNKTPILFSIKNIFLFGLGIPASLLTVTGITITIIKQRISLFTIFLLWLVLMIAIQGMQFAQTMRYFIYFYPFFSLFAGFGFSALLHKKQYGFVILVVVLLLIWPLSFFSIYLSPHTRVRASEWINKHLPSNSVILGEYWDDSLPLAIAPGKNFSLQQLHVFDEDSPEKWITMQKELASGNYLILSSNRGWGTIENLPEKFPKMSKWYKDLFANKLPYKKIAEFRQYPSLVYFGIPLTIPDTESEEAFTVYDHPTVIIFQHK